MDRGQHLAAIATDDAAAPRHAAGLAGGCAEHEAREPSDLAAVTGAILAERGPAAEQFVLRIDASLRPAPTSGDARPAGRLIANLVENALVHNVSEGWLTVRTGVKAGSAVLLIANCGPVIAPGDVNRLLRPFERLGNDRTGQRAGLGLAIAAAIAEAHTATLAVRPSAGVLPAGKADVVKQLQGPNR